MQGQDINSLPPYVVFSYRAVENREEEIKKGKYGFKDVAFAAITRPGQRDTVEKEAEAWLDDLEKKANDGAVPAAWVPHFRAKFDAWKKGEEIPEEGIPLKGWPLLTPGEVAAITQSGIKTVEALAGASDEALKLIGMGAAVWKSKAKNFLDAASGTGALVARTATLERDNADLRAKLEETLALVRQLTPPPEKK